MICPTCNHDNLPGAEVCSKCLQDLTQLDQPAGANRVERSLLEETVSTLGPRRAVTVSVGTAVRDAVGTMLANQIGALLVLDGNGKLAGVFTERDLLFKLADRFDELGGEPLEKYMTPKPETVTATEPLVYALHKMDNGGYRHLPVVENGAPTGMISVRDMIRHITHLCKNGDAAHA